MELSTLLFLAGGLACPIVMGTMMWLMMKNMGGQSSQSTSGQHVPAASKERLATLHAQQQALEAEIVEVTRLAELEAQREVLLGSRESTRPKTSTSAVQSVDGLPRSG